VDYGSGATLTKMAFEKIPVIGPSLLTFGIITFAFSTILGWSYYGERAVEYLSGKRYLILYRVLYVGAVFVGAIVQLHVVWNVADLLNGLMAIPNLVSLLALAGVIVAETRQSADF